MKIQNLLPDFVVENKYYELKSRLSKNDNFSWLKTVDAFANSKGGDLILGVDDKSYELCGYEANKLDEEKQYFYTQLSQHFITNIKTDVEVLEYIDNDNKKYIIKIKIYESETKPVILKFNSMPMVFVRRDGYTQIPSIEEYLDMVANSRMPAFDVSLSNEKFDFDSFKKLKKYYFENTNEELTIKSLASINFFDENMVLRNGSLLFKDDYKSDKTKVVCSVYNGISRGDDFVVASNSFSGNILDCLEFMYSFINQRMNKGFIKTERNRIDIDSFPKRSLLEALINSLAHRDYLIDNSAIYVDLFKDRLVVSTPGKFYKGDDLPITYNLNSFISRRRNSLICDIFVLCKVMEAKGTGLEKIAKDYENVDISHRPFIFSKNNQFCIVLPDLTYQGGVNVNLESLQLLKPIDQISKHDLDILSFCYVSYKSSKEISTYLSISDSSYFRKNILQRLVDQNFLLVIEENNTRKYKTNTEIVKTS